MRQPYNSASLAAFELFATEARQNAKVNKLDITSEHIKDMWRHLPEYEEASPKGMPSCNGDNVTHSWSGRG